MRTKKEIILSVIITVLFTMLIFNVNSQQPSGSTKGNWVWLFEGESTDAWRDLKSTQFPEQGWIVEDGVLTVLGKNGNEPYGHDIITKDQYSNFELELEFKLTKGANSGIKYFVRNDFPGHEGNYLGLEYQLIDDERHADAKMGKDGNRKLASLYDLIPPLKNKKVNSPGKWNKANILVDGSHVEHWLNGEIVLEFNRHSDSFRKLVSESKYKKLQKFGESSQGHILLQGHGDEVSFRQIRIRTW